MTFLLFTIIISAFIYVIFKLFDQYNVNLFQAIVFNYLVCMILGFLFSGKPVGEIITNTKPALPYAFVLGLCFIIVFNFIGSTSQKIGVGVASIADKLSLVLPVLFAFIAYKEPVTALKVVGILCSLVAVYFIISFNKKQREKAGKYWYFPIVVFLGGGFIGTLLKDVQVKHPSINENQFLIFLFGIAFFVGFLGFIAQRLLHKTSFSVRSMFAGFLFGIPNYASIYFLMKSLNTGIDSSIVFPIVNIGVMLLTTVFGVFLFKEQLSYRNKIGVFISIIAITLLLLANLS